MRILCNAESLTPLGGITMSTLQLCREFAARGDTITLLRHDGGELEAAYREFTTDIVAVRSFHLRLASPLSDAVKLPDAVGAAWKARPDVIYLQRAEQLVWAALSTFGGQVVTPRPGRRRRGTPLVVHLRHHPAGAGLRTLSRRVTTFVAVSEFIRREWIETGIDPGKIVTIHNGIDPADYPFGSPDARSSARSALGLPEDVPMALYYGRLDPEKGLDHLLRAWRIVRAAQPDAVLVVVGDSVTHPDPRAQAQALASEAGVITRPSTRDVVSYLHACDSVVLPATWDEPFGRVVIEGMSAGRPVVAPAAGGIPEILTGPYARWLYPRSDDAALAERLIEVIGARTANDGEAARMRGHVELNFSLRRTVESVHAVLTAAVERRPATVPLPSLAPQAEEA